MAQSVDSNVASSPSRRDFVRGSALAVGAAIASQAISSSVYAAGSDVLKVGLIGCGGRGTGAAANALHADANAKLVAIGDLFPDKLERTFETLKKEKDIAAQVAVAEDHKFSGWDAYQKVIAASDVVLLATPPHFRPLHVRAVIEAGKHCFCEKPVATDAPGVRSVMETTRLAKEKNVSLVSGLCYRYDTPKIETIKRLHDGAIGDFTALQTTYNTGGLWSNARKPEWSDMEWQLRNWLYFTWLSGDHITEQHIHSLDKILWTMNDELPLKVTANGGRACRTQPEFGNVYDHFNCTYEWKSGIRCFASCRQWVNCDADVSDWVFGTKGRANIQQHLITGDNAWKGKAGANMYDLEHIALFKSIRTNEPINNGDYMCKSTMMAIMGRMSAYTGKTITSEQALASTEDLRPAKYEFGPLDYPPLAVPGKTKMV